MFQMRNIFTVVLSLGVFASACHQLRCEETASYRVTFDATWSAETHPTDFPNGAHFSNLIGGTHTDQVTFWEVGGIATRGIEAMAENGTSSIFLGEVKGAMNGGTAGSQISGGLIRRSPGSVAVEFDVAKEFPLLTLVSMIAPSPDWFIGTSGFNLRPDGDWIGRTVYDLIAFDSGTDSGPSYSSPNDNTLPKEPIASLEGIYPFENDARVGTFTIVRLLDGDFDESGTLDANDINTISTAIRESSQEERYDLDDNGTVNADDRDYWVKDLKATFYGDANLDGMFGSSDLIQVFQAGEYEDTIQANSGWEEGDWDGDGDFGSGDLVAAFVDGGFENTSAAAAAAEPGSSVLGLLAISGWLLATRCRRSYARSR